MKTFRIVLSLLIALALPFPLEAGVLRGHIDKRDTVRSNAAYAMAYIEECRTGATADENGDFRLVLPERYDGKTVRVEYSLIGYTAVEKDLVVTPGGERADTVVLDFSPIMLAASYVTADGKDPAEYILSQVWKTADRNRKKVKNYSADVTYTLGTHELPVIASCIPGFTLMMGKIAAGFMGIGPIVDYSTRHEDLLATVSLSRVVKNGVKKDSNHQILEIQPDNVPKNVQNNIKSVFGKIDLYGMLYSTNNNAWGRKFTRRSTFLLEGSYNYGNYIVDVLHWEDPNSDASATIHVIEDLWQILKVQVGRQEEAVLCEARDYGGGVFMPVSFVIKPALTRVKAKDIPMFIERVKVEIKDKAIQKRAIKLLQGYQQRGEDFNPYITARYNVRYGTN